MCNRISLLKKRKTRLFRSKSDATTAFNIEEQLKSVVRQAHSNFINIRYRAVKPAAGTSLRRDKALTNELKSFMKF